MGPKELAAKLDQSAEEHQLEERPPRFDFFRAHPSQKN